MVQWIYRFMAVSFWSMDCLAVLLFPERSLPPTARVGELTTTVLEEVLGKKRGGAEEGGGGGRGGEREGNGEEEALQVKCVYVYYVNAMHVV